MPKFNKKRSNPNPRFSPSYFPAFGSNILADIRALLLILHNDVMNIHTITYNNTFLKVRDGKQD